MDAAFFDGLSAAFFAIHEDQCECDFSAFALDGIDRFEGGSAGGDHVIDDDHAIAGFEIAFDLFACAVTFGFLADGENLERLVRVLGSGGHADGERDRVCAEGHAADSIDFEGL